MASTRVFVRGLPPNVKESDLRKHFDRFDSADPTSSILTDAHFIPQRRIGYVGYKTPEMAAKAVKYFNKTFIRMSRIVVETARPIDDAESLRPKIDQPVQNSKQQTSAVSQQDNDSPNYRLASLARNLQRDTKSQVWSNEDDEVNQAVVITSNANVIQGHGDDDNTENEVEYQHIRKRQKTSLKDSDKSHTLTPTNTEAQSTAATSGDIAGETIDGEAFPLERLATSHDQTVGSDADWLRSRTNRVLDMLEDEDVDAKAFREEAPERERVMARTNLTSPSDLARISLPGKSSELHADADHTVNDDAAIIQGDGRLIVRNLFYDALETDLFEHFRPFGSLDEVHICHEKKSGRSRGFAFVQFDNPQDAEAARNGLHGKPFQGRNLLIHNAAAKRDNGIGDVALARLPLKVQNQIKRKRESSTETFRWNSMYMSSDAIMSSVATRLGVSKSDVLDPTSADAAVKQAHAETKTIQDTQSYFKKNGVDVNAFKPTNRQGTSETVILVKNFPFGTTASEIRAGFEKYGPVKLLLIPPTGTIAIIELEQPTHARAAFAALAYSKFKDSVLLLEKAPRALLTEDLVTPSEQRHITSAKALDEDVLQQFEQQQPALTSSLFADKLPWSVTTDSLSNLFRPLDGFLSANVVTRLDPQKPGALLSRGFGFIEFKTKAQAKAALQTMNGYLIDNQQPLVLKPSHKAADVAEERREDDRNKKMSSQDTKIIIKNLPFEATKKDVRALFNPYGQLRSVRVPKKFDSSSRGFAFADFVTSKEARNAMEALRNTHLLGRKLVLDVAASDALDQVEEIERMQRKVERQSDKIELQKLTGGARKRFNAHNAVDD